MGQPVRPSILRDLAQIVDNWPQARPTFKQVAFGMAFLWSSRATCPRLAAGAVSVDNHFRLLSAGYNGAVRGADHCTDVGCEMVAGHCLRSLHAEENMVVQATRTGVSLVNSHVYITARPCQKCTKLMIQAGVVDIHYWHAYNSDALEDQVEKLCKHAGVPLYGPYAGPVTVPAGTP